MKNIIVGRSYQEAMMVHTFMLMPQPIGMIKGIVFI